MADGNVEFSSSLTRTIISIYTGGYVAKSKYGAQTVTSLIELRNGDKVYIFKARSGGTDLALKIYTLWKPLFYIFRISFVCLIKETNLDLLFLKNPVKLSFIFRL